MGVMMIGVVIRIIRGIIRTIITNYSGDGSEKESFQG